MAEYRRRRDSDTWHWCSNCENYPTSNYETSPGKPSSGDLCNQCKAKDRDNNCK